MLEVVNQLREAIRSSGGVAYCRLVETRGSTPQKAGALMLVFPDGSQAGTLGGGCVEAEVKRRALLAMEDGQSCVERFMLDSDFGWDDGLICGGRMEVLILPIQGDQSIGYFTTLADRVGGGQAVTEVVDFSDPQKPVLRLFDESEDLLGELGAESSRDDAAREHLQSLVRRPRAYAHGSLAYLPVLARCRLIIVGGGHVGKAVADLAANLDFDVWVVDDRADFVAADRFPKAQRRLHGDMDDVLSEIDVTADTYCLIVTRGHNHDEKALFHLADRGARYVGMIGSRRKIRLILDDLLEEGISPAALERVFAPVGVDIGSQTVPEIALSICAELVAHRNRQGDVPGRESSASADSQLS